MIAAVPPGRRVWSGLLRIGSSVAALLIVAATALILLPVPVAWFSRWIPWSLIVQIGTIGNRVGPFLVAGPLVGLLAWQAEHPAVRNRRRGVVGDTGRWVVSIAVFSTVIMAVVIFGRH